MVMTASSTVFAAQQPSQDIQHQLKGWIKYKGRYFAFDNSKSQLQLIRSNKNKTEVLNTWNIELKDATVLDTVEFEGRDYLMISDSKTSPDMLFFALRNTWGEIDVEMNPSERIKTANFSKRTTAVTLKGQSYFAEFSNNNRRIDFYDAVVVLTTGNKELAKMGSVSAKFTADHLAWDSKNQTLWVSTEQGAIQSMNLKNDLKALAITAAKSLKTASI